MSRVQSPSPTPTCLKVSATLPFLLRPPRSRTISFSLSQETHNMSLYWINLEDIRLGIMPRPRGNDWLPDDLLVLKQAGVDIIVSALTTSEAEELGLLAEADGCARNGLDFISFPIEDRSLPTNPADFHSFVAQVVGLAKNGKSVAIHCRAGIGRSSVIAASVLIRLGLSPADAFRTIEESRGCPVPDTPEQRRWVERNSDPSVPVSGDLWEPSQALEKPCKN
jgi:protein-tyrosine phosphatase